ncbi:MAG: PfkB family carbohydrate kinase [bacterium]
MSDLIALTAGHLTRDRYPEGDEPGGGVWYVAHAWRALKVASRAVTAADPADVPARWPGEVAVQASGRTTTFCNTYGPTGRAMRLDAQAPPVVVSSVPAEWRRCDVLLLAPVAAELDPERWLAAIECRWSGAGLQGWLKARTADGRFVPRPSGLDPRALAGLGVACLSDEDLGDDRAWLDGLRAVVPLVVLTHGAAGCTVFAGGDATRVAAAKAVEVDPTGAGDTFAAALMVNLADGFGPVMAATRAGELAARCVERRGPVGGM